MWDLIQWLLSEGAELCTENPGHFIVEATFAVIIVFLALQRPRKIVKGVESLTKKEVDELVEDWEPEPLVPEMTESQAGFKNHVIDGLSGPRAIVDGKEVTNLVACNFLGLIGNKQIENSARAAIDKYGVGSCGPRGFYGTVDVHLNLEERLAKFFGTEEAIVYSFGIATVSSTIPAFAKRGDLVIADEGVNFAIQTGINLSRSRVIYFKHNDVNDLERILEEVKKEDIKGKKKLNRRFIFVEGVYQNYGDMSPLPEIVALKDKYKFRLLVEDTFGFGVVGKTGRGSLEHWGVAVESVEILTGSMSQALAAGGGFCTGSSKVCDHQRLSGLGYCFSASMPPFVSVAATKALDILDASPQKVSAVQDNSNVLRVGLSDNCEALGLRVGGESPSAVIHLRLTQSSGDRTRDCDILQLICDRVLERGVFLSRALYMTSEANTPEPSIKIAVSADHKKEHLDEAVDVIRDVWPTVCRDMGVL